MNINDWHSPYRTIFIFNRCRIHYIISSNHNSHINCRHNRINFFHLDKSGNTNFWNKDFVNALPIRDDDYLTKRFGELCVNFAKRGIQGDADDKKRIKVANTALNYLSEHDDFKISEFESSLEEPEIIDQFTTYKSQYEEDSGHRIGDQFKVSKKEAGKAKQKLKEIIKLDTGVQKEICAGGEVSGDTTTLEDFQVIANLQKSKNA